MEYAECGDLLKKISLASVSSATGNKINFEEKEIWKMLFQILSGLKVLHDRKVCHRDLKSANIFISRDQVLKIGDLNISKRIGNDKLKTQIGTPNYVAPEVWAKKPYDLQCDIWAVGCILYQLCTFMLPFEAQKFEELREKIIAGNYKKIEQEYSDCLKHTVYSLLQSDPVKRPTCSFVFRF